MNGTRVALGVLLLLIWLGGVIPCQARNKYQIPPELAPLWPAEEEIVKKTAAGEVANLKQRFGEEAERRKIRAKFLEALLLEEIKGLKIHRHGVDIKFAIINEDLDLQGAKVSGEVKLVNCFFRGNVNCPDSQFEQNLQFSHSQFEGQAIFSGMTVDKTAKFEGTVFLDLVNFSRAKIGDELSLKGAYLLSPKRANFSRLKVDQNLRLAKVFKGPVELRDLKVEEQLNLEDAEFYGGAFFAGSVIGRGLLAYKAHFLSKQEYASFHDLKVGDIADFRNAVFNGPVDFNRAEIGSEFLAERAAFDYDNDDNKGIEAGDMKVGSKASFRDATFKGRVNFSGSDIKGQLLADGVKFLGTKPVYFCGIKIRQVADFTYAKFNVPEISFKSAIIGGKLVADIGRDDKQGAVFEGVAGLKGQVILSDGKFYDLSIGGKEGDFPEIGELNLERTVVDRNITIENVKIGKFKAKNLEGKGQTKLKGLAIGEEADLGDSRFSNLSLEVKWPETEKENVKFSGMEYGYLCTIEHPTKKDDWRNLIDLIGKGKFDAQNYRKLESFLRQKGQDSLADEVFILMRREENQPQHWYQWLNPALWMKILIWDYLAGYGRTPFNVVWAAVVIVIMGMYYNDPQYVKGVKRTKNTLLGGLWGRFLLSLEQFIPMVDLGLRKKWEPREISWFLATVIYGQRLLGWILIPIFLAAIYTKFK